MFGSSEILERAEQLTDNQEALEAAPAERDRMSF